MNNNKYLRSLELAVLAAVLPVLLDYLQSSTPMDIHTVIKAVISAALGAGYGFWRTNPPPGAVSLIAFLALLTIPFSGCTSLEKQGAEYAKFIQAIPGVKANNVSLTIDSIAFSVTESATQFDTNPDTGLMEVVQGTSIFSVPLAWGYKRTFTLNAFSLQASPTQLAAARAAKAASLSASPHLQLTGKGEALIVPQGFEPSQVVFGDVASKGI